MEVVQMNNAEVIRGIDMTISGLNIIKSALGAIETTTPVAQVMNEPVEEKKITDVPKFDAGTLSTMKYNEFKKYAAQLGVDCKGTRDEIMQRVLALNAEETSVENDEGTTEESVVEEKQEKSDRPAKSKKFAKAEANEPTRDAFDEQAEAVAKDTDVEDIIEALADVNVKANKNNAVEKLAEALRKGLIELDDEEESEESVEDNDESEDGVFDVDVVEETEDEDDSDEEDEDFSADSYFPEYDPEGLNAPADMSDERAEAVQTKMQEIIEAVENESLTVEDIQSYLEDHCTEDEASLIADDAEDEEYLKLYMELVKRTIDNNGEEHEPSDPYEVGKHDLCCGHELKYSKKTKKYICEICGTEYEAE
jgi:hypothetical protein